MAGGGSYTPTRAGAAGFISYRGLQLLLALPLSLALFALVLQLLHGSPAHPAHVHLTASVTRYVNGVWMVVGVG